MRRVLGSHILITLGSIWVSLAATATPITAPTVQYSQDGRHFLPLSLLDTTVSARRFYRYHLSTGHPAFGITLDTATVSLVWDSTDHALALLFISGGGQGGAGRGVVTLTGMPRDARIAVADDAAEFYYSPRRGKLLGKFHYGGSTDGFVLAKLESLSFTAKLSLSNRLEVDHLRLTNGDPTQSGQFVSLNLKKPLYLRVVSAGTPAPVEAPPGNGVPEPTGLSLLLLSGIALLSRRRIGGRPNRR